MFLRRLISSVSKQLGQTDFAKKLVNRKYAALETRLDKLARVPSLFCVSSLPDTPNHSYTVEIEFSNDRIFIGLPPHLDAATSNIYADRLLPIVSLLVDSQRAGADGKILLCLGDSDHVPGVAFCSNLPGSTVIPDFEYVASRAYHVFAKAVQKHAPVWHSRKPIAVWRGLTTGVATGPDWRSLPRVQLCKIANQRPDLFDVGLTGIAQLGQAQEVERELKSDGLMRPFMKRENWANYKYHIDIDGNSNAWSGLFTKLMTGSPVLKVASPGHYRQWYYDQLRPFVNYVPVLSDMSDLTEKLLWLHGNDDKAQAIGLAGQALVRSLGYESEMEKARNAIKKACAI